MGSTNLFWPAFALQNPLNIPAYWSTFKDTPPVPLLHLLSADIICEWSLKCSPSCAISCPLPGRDDTRYLLITTLPSPLSLSPSLSTICPREIIRYIPPSKLAEASAAMMRNVLSSEKGCAASLSQLQSREESLNVVGSVKLVLCCDRQS